MEGMCEICRYYGIDDSKCHRYPTPVAKSKDEWCGEFERPIAVLRPPTKKELEAKKREQTRSATDEELRQQAEARSRPKEGGY